jgi:hypothetical protein
MLTAGFCTTTAAQPSSGAAASGRSTDPAMSKISLKDAFSVSEDAVFRELEGEAVLLNLDSGTYFGLDQMGTTMWNLLREHGSLQTVFEMLLQQYDVESDVLEQDLLGLVAELCGKGLGRVASDD